LYSSYSNNVMMGAEN